MRQVIANTMQAMGYALLTGIAAWLLFAYVP